MQQRQKKKMCDGHSRHRRPQQLAAAPADALVAHAPQRARATPTMPSWDSGQAGTGAQARQRSARIPRTRMLRNRRRRLGRHALAAHVHIVQVAHARQLAEPRAVAVPPRLERTLHLRRPTARIRHMRTDWRAGQLARPCAVAVSPWLEWALHLRPRGSDRYQA